MLSKSWIAGVRRLLPAGPIDVGSPDEHPQRRDRQIVLTALSAGAAKFLGIIVSFVTVALTVKYLGAERYGLWATVSSAVAMLGFADLGIGSGLMNEVASAYGRDDLEAIRRHVAVGALLLLGIAVVVLVLFGACYPFIAWDRLVNVSSDLARQEAAKTVAVVVILFALGIPASLAIKVQMGLQLGFMANLWLSAASILSLIAVVAIIHFDGGVPSIAAAVSGPQVLMGLLAALYFFARKNSALKPTLAGVTKTDIKSLSRTSMLFLILQIAALVAFQSDNLIIAHFLGAAAVTGYAVAFKLFSLPAMLLALFMNAMWPAYAESSSRGDREWIYRTFFKSLRYSALIVVPMSLALFVGGKWIIEKWVGSSFIPSYTLLTGLLLWSVLTILGGNFAALLNGLGIIRFQVITSSLMAITNIAISVILVKIIGAPGVVWGSVISLAFVQYLPTAIFVRKYLK